jgi:DNA-binding LytR/AlgR family response regulator
MFSVLAQPYPAFVASKKGIFVCLLTGVCVFAVLSLLQPFGMARLQTGTLLLHSFIYGVNTFLISLLLTVAIPAAWPAAFAEEKWTVGREIGWLFLVTTCVAVSNLFINNWLSNGAINAQALLRFLGITFSVSILPLSVAVLFKQRGLYKKYKKAAEQLNAGLPAEHNSETGLPDTETAFAAQEAAVIVLTGDNQQEQLTLPLHGLLLISTADNYVTIFHTRQGTAETALFRGTLKKMETQLQAHRNFVRCHRSHIVNLQQVRRVTGNAQGYKLEVTGLTEPVPVGRNYNEVIKTQLAHLRQ